MESKARLDDEKIRHLNDIKATLDRQQAAVNTEIKVQQDQVAEMDKRKKDAEKAIASVGGSRTTGFASGATAPAPAPAAPAPRKADGTLGCSPAR
jgi:hypothetical protein